MKILETIFDCCHVLEPSLRSDCRGVMEDFYRKAEEILHGFTVAEQRIYTIPVKHTFFGIHYQKSGSPQGKLIGVIQGSGIDYIVDLRPGSATYKRYASAGVIAYTDAQINLALPVKDILIADYDRP